MSAYGDTILADVPSLYWRLGASGASDLSGNGRNGTGQGSITIGGATGAIVGDTDDTATDFDGSNDRITSSYTPWVDGAIRTFEGWAFRDTQAADHGLVSSTTAATGDPQVRLGSGANATKFYYWQQGQAGTIEWDAWPGVGQWVHWALITDRIADSFELFINGRSQGSLSYTQALASNPFQVGAIVGGFVFFDGKMDEIAVYESALTAAQILNHYNVGRQGFALPNQQIGPQQQESL